MTLKIRLPGELRPSNDITPTFKTYADIFQVEEETNVSLSRSRGTHQSIVIDDVQPDDVLELTWEDGIIELIRADELNARYGEINRDVSDDAISVPARRPMGGTNRGLADIGLNIIKRIKSSFIEKATEDATTIIAQTLEPRHMEKPGLYHLGPDGVRTTFAHDLQVSPDPYLVLIHGTFSSTAGSFDKLFTSVEWKRLYQGYVEGHVLALEHFTVTKSPVDNALQILSELPQGAKLHLLTYSRGGLIGDLFCRPDWENEEVEQFFPQSTYPDAQAQLNQFRDQRKNKDVKIERYVRVASPAAGTLLASERADTYLNIILTLVGKLTSPAAAAAYEFIKATALTIIKTRTKADKLPGLEAMMPHMDKGYIPFLNSAKALDEKQEIGIIAGDLSEGGALTRVKAFFANLYYREDNDLVVDSKSMFRGVPRENAWGLYARGPHADHFSYFKEDATRIPIVGWLEDKKEGFSPLRSNDDYGGLRGNSTRAIPDNKPTTGERPVLFFLPGIMGSHLAHDSDRQWIHPGRIAFGGISKLKIDTGKIYQEEPYQDQISPDGLINLVYERLYDRLIKHYDVLTFDFDWRIPIRDSAALLVEQIKAELSNHQQPIRILAHSMGGLVARSILSEYPRVWEKMTQRGGRLVMLGTPNYGSYVPAQVVTQKHKLLQTLAKVDLRNSLKDLTVLVRDFPGLMEMLPYKTLEEDGAEKAFDLITPESWNGFEAYRPDPTILENAKAFRQRLNQAIDADYMVYVAGHDKATPTTMEKADNKVTFRYTGRGDGAVPWELGRLPKVETYYVDAEHGQLPNYPPAFDGYLELLSDGRTNKLSNSPPVIQRDTETELFTLAEEEQELELRVYPNEADIFEAIAGRAWELQPDFTAPIKLEVTNADIREAKYPVIAGHYIGDPIVSVESVLDKAIGGTMSRDLQIGRYPGPHGTVRIYDTTENLKGGVIVTGLGEVGKLQKLSLEGDLVSAMLEYALRHIPEDAAPLNELSLSSILIGSFGGSRITVEESVSSIFNAALTTNHILTEKHLGNCVQIRCIEIVELYRDIAINAGHAAQTLRIRHEQEVDVTSKLNIRASGRSSRPISPYGAGWSRRIQITNYDKYEGLKFFVTTDMARSEPYIRIIQWKYVDNLLSESMTDPICSCATLFQYLLPYQFLDNALDTPDLVLGLDSHTARIPWELLDPDHDKTSGQLPLGVRVGVLRTLSTPECRENPRRASGRKALVIGDPVGVNPQLPGAKKEAIAIADYLEKSNIKPERQIGTDTKSIFKALYKDEYDIIHIAAHGDYNAEDPSKSGVLIGQEDFLTTGEFKNLKAVPSIVFLNCCHLGKLGEGSLGRNSQPGHLAASLAQKLIEMGVGVVVVAGWAVGDQSAQVFAKNLYEQLIGGNTLMNAVRLARAATYNTGSPNDLTWGAYQVYGDPGFTFYWVDRRNPTQFHNHVFVSPDELQEHLQDFSQRANGADDLKRLSLKRQLDELAQNIDPQWQHKGEITSGLGKAYSDLGYYAEAVFWYEKAIETSKAPIEAIERLVNMKARAAEQILKPIPHQPPLTPKQKDKAESWFASAQDQINGLLAIQESSERYSLLGSILKRLAKTAPKDVRKPRIKEARNAYAAACGQKPENLYYPLSQQVALDLCLDPNRDIDKELKEIEKSAKSHDDEWSQAALAEVALLRYLSIHESEASVEDIAKAYYLAWTKGTGRTQREKDSAFDQLDSLIELSSYKDTCQRVKDLLMRLMDT
ncbi:CHAT domain-containing protein [Acaryochloris marina]|uniref:DUF7379 domain-containing protein n=1 Tax=Acaryochloris marina TaxID=155978 RepID=UPI001BB01B8A|nr:CHAT domain-containing protein [Acaryochloris marina]QUY41586.1 CHAT domain-containing protein [Acaryochloris marina S15]